MERKSTSLNVMKNVVEAHITQNVDMCEEICDDNKKIFIYVKTVRMILRKIQS